MGFKAVRFLNVGLRLATLLGKFAGIYALAMLLPPADVGRFGLAMVTVALAVAVVGAEFYTFSQRELIATEGNSKWRIIINHLAASLILLVPISLIALVVNQDVSRDLLGVSTTILFCILLGEYFSLEASRFLIGLERQLRASIVVLCRQAAWLVIAVGCMYFIPEARSLKFLFATWVAGVLCSSLLGAWLLWRSIPGIPRLAVDIRWITQGFRVSAAFIVGAIALRLIGTVDRFFVEHFTSIEIVGAYTLYAGISMAIVTFMDAGVTAFGYPRLVRIWRQSDRFEFMAELKRLCVEALLMLIVLTAIAAVAIGPMVALLGSPVYSENLSMFWILIGGCFIYGMGMVAHYGLYAVGADRILMTANLLGVASFLFLIAAANEINPKLVVPMAVLVGYLVISVVKAFHLRKKVIGR